jgi:hypothetical protein
VGGSAIQLPQRCTPCNDRVGGGPSAALQTSRNHKKDIKNIVKYIFINIRKYVYLVITIMLNI